MNSVRPIENDFSAALPGFRLMSAATRDTLRTASDCTAETGRFLSQRLGKDAELLSTLARCDDPLDVADCMMRFFGIAVADYSLQTQRMTVALGRNLQSTCEDIEGQIGLAKVPVID